MHYAALDGNLAEAAQLIAQGLDVNAHDAGGMSPLHFAAQGQHAEVARALLLAGASVDAEDKYGTTALFTATSNSCGLGATIAVLREFGADALHAKRNKVTPVALARMIANYPVAPHFSDLS